MRNSLNPFHKLTPEQKEELIRTCGWVHEKFIAHVKKYRGDKLKIDDRIFSGEIYNGTEAQEVGLIDEVGSMVEVLNRLYPGSKLDIDANRSWRSALLGAI